MQNIRLRFAPSPTGPLHIGGVRTALYNFLLAKKHGGTFILRIEDTDQNRYVPGAEEYIIESLLWCGLKPDEGPGFGGEYGPYRQSERKEIYRAHVDMLLQSGHAYYAFDTPEELEARRAEAGQNFKYDASIRMEMRNSLRLGAGETKKLLEQGVDHVVRLKVPEGEEVVVNDLIRGEVRFQSLELDDKVLLKGDGMPTYHLANIVDDRLMRITHVIRGEEWLPSTGHHALLYRAFGWESEMPVFAHLPLILKPDGKGKLSKRDGARLGIPVFPLSWKSDNPDDSFEGFREFGFDPRALVNFMALLGWNSGTEQEIFSIDELTDAFSIEKISKAGARFDYDKAKWFNHQYLQARPNEDLARDLRPFIEAKGLSPAPEKLEAFCALLKNRAHLLPDFWEEGRFLLEEEVEFDAEAVAKKWKPELAPGLEEIVRLIGQQSSFEAVILESEVKELMKNLQIKPGEMLPVLRIALTGALKGPGVFEMMQFLGREAAVQRLERARHHFMTSLA
jgi:glutamyl-tRNA synthetase